MRIVYVDHEPGYTAPAPDRAGVYDRYTAS